MVFWPGWNQIQFYTKTIVVPRISSFEFALPTDEEFSKLYTLPPIANQCEGLTSHASSNHINFPKTWQVLAKVAHTPDGKCNTNVFARLYFGLLQPFLAASTCLPIVENTLCCLHSLKVTSRTFHCKEVRLHILWHMLDTFSLQRNDHARFRPFPPSPLSALLKHKHAFSWNFLHLPPNQTIATSTNTPRTILPCFYLVFFLMMPHTFTVWCFHTSTFPFTAHQFPVHRRALH